MKKEFKSIKNMDPKVWSDVKSESAKYGLTISEFIGKLMKEHKEREKSSGTQLERILKDMPKVTDEEYERIKKRIEDIFEKVEWESEFECKRE